LFPGFDPRETDQTLRFTNKGNSNIFLKGNLREFAFEQQLTGRFKYKIPRPTNSLNQLISGRD
jgi:hypothetical protein